MTNQISFIALGGIGDVTRNMYVYEFNDEIFLVDCGIGFADETMLGVDLLLPDISYLLNTNKKIVGMALSHGHEDHIGALPFILPQLPQFPIYATPLTAALANEKLKEFELPSRVQSVPFTDEEIQMGNFKISFLRITHSVPDSSHIVIKTPAGNLYHGADFKIDLTPYDGKKSDYLKISKAGAEGVMALMSDCLGSEREGITPTEQVVTKNFDEEIATCKGKCLITTYSSNISRLNQAIAVAKKYNRRVCFVGRSLIKAKEVAQKLGYLQMEPRMEVTLDQIKNYPDNQLLMLVAGSQGQENSALTRIVNGEHRDVKLNPEDVIIFSSDPIPGNEVSVSAVIDSIARIGCRVIYSAISDDFHVSGHGSSYDLMLLMSLLSAQYVIPISGQYRQMVAYKRLAERLGYDKKAIFLLEDGQELLLSKESAKLGKKIPIRNVYVDEITGGELDSYVMRDRQKLLEGGIVIVMAEVDSSTGQLASKPELVIRGFTLPDDKVNQKVNKEIEIVLQQHKNRVINWLYIRKRIAEVTERMLFRELRRRPLVLPVVIEV